MKKLVLFAAVVVAVSFASCKPKAAQEPVAPEVEEAVVVDEVEVQNDSTVEVIEVGEVQ